MSNHVIYLSEAENCTLTLLSKGFSTREIHSSCEIPLSGYAIFTQDLRRKTGIRDHRDSSECRAYVAKYQQAITGEGPNGEQTRAMRSFSLGNTITAIAYILGRITEEATEQTIDAGCRAAGIFTRDDRARRGQIRLYLAIFRPNFKPLTEQETQILRAMAEGKTFEEVSQTVVAARIPYLKTKAKDACMRLGFDIKGRNSQRNLLRAYFAHLDTLAPRPHDPMDDPAF
jgi:hypothetical protein